MNEYQVAHLNIENQNMIVIPLDSTFRLSPQSEKVETYEQLQICASGAGLKGHVVVVWQDVSGIKFMAPPQWHSYFQSITWSWVRASLNKTLTCR